jgi:RHS repeat-associated protein
LFVTKLLLKDHLGSMVAEVAITGTVNASGQVTSVSVVANGIVVHGFGPWGNTRNAASPLNGDSRGFTGHEHLAELGLIHMNGRIYDPVIGRFLQADPIVQAPHNAQSHNRYSYVVNNPLSFTDPSGFSSWTRFRDKWLKPIISIAVAWAIGPIGFWSMQGGLAGAMMGNVAVGVSSSGVVSTANFLSSVMAGFAAGGINGGNIQSALRGALTGGILQGFGDAIGSAMASSGAPAASPVGADVLSSTGAGRYMLIEPSTIPLPREVPGGDLLETAATHQGNVARVFEQLEVSGCCKPWYSGIRDWYRSSVASFQSATVGDSFSKVIAGLPAAGAIASVSRVSNIAKGASTATPSAYSVAYRTTIPRTAIGTTIDRGAHFSAANRSLEAAMAADAEFAQMMSALNVRLPLNMSMSPNGWTWHHVYDMPGVLELVPRVMHAPGSAWQPLLHYGPGRSGGMAQWGKNW